MPDMLAYRSEKMDAGCLGEKVLDKCAAYEVLIIDERLIDKPAKEQMHFLLELTKRRYANSSTIYCLQYGADGWHRRMGGGVHAEFIFDRIRVLSRPYPGASQNSDAPRCRRASPVYSFLWNF